MALRVVSWNVHQLDEPWRLLAGDPTIDLALLQEAKPPPSDVTCDVVPPRGDSWTMPGYRRTFCTAIARLSNRIVVPPRRTAELSAASSDALGVSRAGTIAVADVEHKDEVLTCVSVYSLWEKASEGALIYAEASAHRLL